MTGTLTETGTGTTNPNHHTELPGDLKAQVQRLLCIRAALSRQRSAARSGTHRTPGRLRPRTGPGTPLGAGEVANTPAGGARTFVANLPCQKFLSDSTSRGSLANISEVREEEGAAVATCVGPAAPGSPIRAPLTESSPSPPPTKLTTTYREPPKTSPGGSGG